MCALRTLESTASRAPGSIERFVDKDTEFLYVASDAVAAEAKRAGATAYDIKDADLGHHGAECGFDAFVHRYALDPRRPSSPIAAPR